MNKFTRGIITAAALTFSFGAFSFSANACGYNVGKLEIEHPWSRETPPNATVAGAFLKVKNQGDVEDTLVSAESPIAEKVELHAHVHENGMMKMRQVEGIAIPANGSEVLKPGSYHVMLFGMKKAPRDGETFPMTLNFEKSGSIDIEVSVKKVVKNDTQKEKMHHH